MRKTEISLTLLLGLAIVFIVRPGLCQTGTPPGLDLSRLDSDERLLFEGIVEEQFCPCGHPRSFAESLQVPDACPIATPLGRFVVEKVEQGLPKKQIVRGLLRRIAQYNSRFEFDLKGSPRLGPNNAPVVIVVFSDFQCPYCRVIAEPLQEIVEKNKDVAVVYKAYPLGFHPFAESAVIAALAAHQQGKFWQMHDLIFENQDGLEEENYDSFAKTLRLDVKKFQKARKSSSINAILKRDIAEGDKANLEGTPTLFINGMLLDDPNELSAAVDRARQL